MSRATKDKRKKGRPKNYKKAIILEANEIKGKKSNQQLVGEDLIAPFFLMESMQSLNDVS